MENIIDVETMKFDTIEEAKKEAVSQSLEKWGTYYHIYKVGEMWVISKYYHSSHDIDRHALKGKLHAIKRIQHP